MVTIEVGCCCVLPPKSQNPDQQVATSYLYFLILYRGGACSTDYMTVNEKQGGRYLHTHTAILLGSGCFIEEWSLQQQTNG